MIMFEVILMSQFIICTGKKPSELNIVDKVYIKDISNDNLLLQITESFELDQNSWTIYDKNKNTTDELFTEAQRLIQNNFRLSETRLGNILNVLFRSKNNFYIWYGDDYFNLPLYSDYRSISNDITKVLEESMAEVYMKVVRK